MLNLQPRLHGPQVILRPLEANDFETLRLIAADPLLWTQHPDTSRGTAEGFKEFFGAALASRGSLTVLDAQRGLPIGCTRYLRYVPGRSVDIGFTFLAREYWGGATNGEMKRLMLEHAFREVPEVHFRVAERNLRSRRAVEKLGAEVIGREPTPRYGQIHVIYRLTPELWAQASAPQYAP